jgi:hypothetical protein
MIWIPSQDRVNWPYSVLPVHSQASTFLLIHLIIPSQLAVSLFIPSEHSSTHITWRWLYRRNIVVDGNFSLEHMKMKHPARDVFLNDGCGYLVESAGYKKHLQSSTETKQVNCLCLYNIYQFIICFLSDHLVPITKLSIRQIQIERICKQQVLVHVHVLAMDALFHTLLLTFRKEKGQMAFFNSPTITQNLSGT